MLKYLKNKYLVVAVVALVWILFFDTNNIFRWVSDMRDVHDQEMQKTYYKREIKNIDEKLKELSSNRDSLEKFAREEYLFHEEDEVIYLFPN